MRHPALILCALAAPAAAEPVALFNGKDLAGWTHEGPRATFAAYEGELKTSGAGNQPNWLHTAREYENFRLRFEYNLSQWAEAAVMVRAPRLGRPMQAGLAVFLGHDFHNNLTAYVTGAVAGVLPRSSTEMLRSEYAWPRSAKPMNPRFSRCDSSGCAARSTS